MLGLIIVQIIMNLKVGHGWRKKPRLAYFVDVCPCINVPCIVFWNIVNRKWKSNFPKSDQNHYSDPLKEWKFRHPYEMKNCRGGQNRALRISWASWHAMRPVHALSSISIHFNIIWSHGCVRTSIICIRPYFDLPYNFSFHKDVWIFTPFKGSHCLVTFGKIGL